MRAIKIDPVEKTVTEIELKKNPNRTFDELYKVIGCDLVQLVQIDREIVVVCDEEGRCKEVKGAFTFFCTELLIAGTAVILGGSGAKFKPLLENLSTFEMITEWVDAKDVPEPTTKVYGF